MSDTVHKVIIIGSGPAGLTAALYTSRAQLEPLLFEGTQPGGQLTITTDVENFPGFPEGIMGPELMANMRAQAARFGTDIRSQTVTKVDFSAQPLKVWVGDEEFHGETVIVSTGASARTLGLPREDEMMGFGLSTCATCDGAFFKDEHIVVIGGGDSACEEAIYLARFGSKVTVVLRGSEFRASKIMAQRAIDHPKVEVVYNHNLVEMLGDRKSGITGGVFTHSDTGEKTEIPCAAIFYAIGHTPNTSLFEGAIEMDEHKYLITNPDKASTTIEGVFACGDVQDAVWRQAITAAGSGCMAAIEAERWLSERE
ncbi:UNVERIFIED_CONTAM: hypothetical protein GTU68_005840 [Idotea baltica]|nr:hypothetical protein [Idotea baltica]